MALLRSLLLLGLLFSLSEAQFVPNYFDPNSINFNFLGIPVSLYCTPDGNRGIFGLAAPPFEGANVALQCGNKAIIASVTTDNYGIGYLVTKPEPVLPFFPLEKNCRVIVNTRLYSCNPNVLARGLLESGLRFTGTSPFENGIIANFAPIGFRFFP